MSFSSPDSWTLGVSTSTSNLRALRHQRGLGAAQIVALHPGITRDQAEDAVALEERLRLPLAKAS